MVVGGGGLAVAALAVLVARRVGGGRRGGRGSAGGCTVVRHDKDDDGDDNERPALSLDFRVPCAIAAHGYLSPALSQRFLVSKPRAIAAHGLLRTPRYRSAWALLDSYLLSQRTGPPSLLCPALSQRAGWFLRHRGAPRRRRREAGG